MQTRCGLALFLVYCCCYVFSNIYLSPKFSQEQTQTKYTRNDTCILEPLTINYLQIDALSEVVREVGDRCEVYLDGGVRFGTDVLKALVLGARAVFIGRPAAWGLTCAVSFLSFATSFRFHSCFTDNSTSITQCLQ